MVPVAFTVVSAVLLSKRPPLCTLRVPVELAFDHTRSLAYQSMHGGALTCLPRAVDDHDSRVEKGVGDDSLCVARTVDHLPTLLRSQAICRMISDDLPARY